MAAIAVLPPLFAAGTNHDHDQPSHLVLKNPGLPTVVNLPHYDGLESRCEARRHHHQHAQACA